MRVRATTGRPETVAADVLVLGVPAEQVGALARVGGLGRTVLAELRRRRFQGDAGASMVVRGEGRLARRVVAVVGLGPAAAVDRDVLARLAAHSVALGRDLQARTVALGTLGAPGLVGEDPVRAAAAIAETAGLATYAFADYRREPRPRRPTTLLIAGLPGGDARALTRALGGARALARATNQARDWINRPAAVVTPRALADEAERVARRAGLEVRIDGPRGIARLGMGALLAVARGSAEEPRFIRLAYRPPGKSGGPRIALVGKAITFDSGGLSLKSAGGMEHMKRDMAGGAAVIAAMQAIAALRPAAEVRAYVPASENLPGGAAMKPGDVLRTASGKTIEVLNTDAEGRLVLADALGVAARDRPDQIVDVATLTGAVRVALGTRLAGIMGNDDALVDRLLAAGEAGGERMWRLPLVASYREDIDSDVADLRNVARQGQAGAIHAGLFLQEFVEGRPWAHLDIAGVAFSERDLPGAPRGAVGFGVRLLTRYVLAAAGGD